MRWFQYVLLALLSLAIVWSGLAILGYVRTRNVVKKEQDRAVTRGLSGKAGQTVSITCPGRQTVKGAEGYFICGSDDPTMVPRHCDAYNQSSGTPTKYTMNANDQLKGCVGKSECKVTVPGNIGSQVCPAAGNESACPDDQVMLNARVTCSL